MVRRYVEANRDRLSPLSVREALKNIDKVSKNSIGMAQGREQNEVGYGINRPDRGTRRRHSAKSTRSS